MALRDIDLKNFQDLNDLALERIDDIEENEEFKAHTSERTYSSMTSSCSGKKAGRNKNAFTLILENFFNSNSKHPKKEFFNAFIIRLIKKSYRQIIHGEMAIGSMKIDLLIQEEFDAWKLLQDIYRENTQEIVELSKTYNGPATDGKCKRINKEISHLSFNNDYCKLFFSEEFNRRAFRVIIELMFLDPDPSTLKSSSKFKFYCCPFHEHSEECNRK